MQPIKKFGRKILFLILLSVTFIFQSSSFSETEKKTKEGIENLQTLTLENFEKPNAWIAKFSRFRRHSWKDHLKATYEPSSKWLHWKKLDTSKNYSYYAKPEPIGREGKDGTTILGVRARFYAKGYNWIVIEPKQDLYMMGKIDTLRVWVWGGNFNYNIYAVVKNYRNKYYTIPMGNTKFLGWKQLSAKLANFNIDQVDIWAPRIKPLQFIRFIIVSNVNERSSRFGIWIDDILYDTNLYDPLYSGKALEKEFDWD